MPKLPASAVADEQMREAFYSLGRLLAGELGGQRSPLDGLDARTKVYRVALQYAWAHLVGLRPIAAVMQACGLPRSTAGRLIKSRRVVLADPTAIRPLGPRNRGL